MSELRSMFRQAGCPVARTYIQSGNVLFRAAEAEARRIGAVVETALAERFGSPIAVVLRSDEELAEAVAANPLGTADRDTRYLHVGFLGCQPPPARVSALDHDRSPPDEFTVRGREVYLYLPNGAGRTKLTAAYFERVLDVPGTFRNWRTTQALCRLAIDMDSV